MKKIEPINIMNKFSLFNEQWTPKIIGCQNLMKQRIFLGNVII